MKNILKKYYELDGETKELLPFLYMYQQLLAIKDDYKNVKIDNMYDEDILMQTIIKCWYSTDFDASDIVDKLFSFLDCQSITISDLKELSIDELQKLMCDEESISDSNIISEFTYKGFYCAFGRSNEKYLLVINKNNKTDVIVIDEFEDIFSALIDKHISEKGEN